MAGPGPYCPKHFSQIPIENRRRFLSREQRIVEILQREGCGTKHRIRLWLGWPSESHMDPLGDLLRKLKRWGWIAYTNGVWTLRESV